MKLFKTFSTLSVALLATFANANTTDVVVAELVKVQPVQAIEIMQSVELNIAASMQEMKVNVETQSFSNQDVYAATEKSSDKQLTAKVTVVAE